jgi:F0F1-type ATP synthase membrane subunit a
MESLIHADIFFFVTTILVVVLTGALIVVSVYVVRILRDMKDISQKVKNESEKIVGDIDNLRDKIKEEGVGLRSLGKFFSFFTPRKKK